MKDISVLLDQTYTLGWTFCNKTHINLEDATCCPLAMYLLANEIIDRSASWLKCLQLARTIFDPQELEGYIHGVDGQSMRLYNYNSVKRYSAGYLIGKKCREKWSA